MRSTLVALAVLAVAGCGGATASSHPPATTHPTPAAPATSTAAPRTLKASCPLIEAAVPSGLTPPLSRWARAVNRLHVIAEAGDQETRNALAGLQKAVAGEAAQPGYGLPVMKADQARLRADDAYLAAVTDMRIRCHAAGSSAFQ